MIRSRLHKLLEVYPHKHMQRDPFFAFDSSVTEILAGSPASVASLKALMEHGLIHLPYPQMTVQFERADDGTDATWVLWLQELDGKFKADLFAYRNETSFGYLSRGVLSTDSSMADCFRAEITPEKSVYAKAERDGKMNEVADDIGYIMVAGLSMAVLMTHIGGLAREEHEAPEKLNIARERKGKPPIRPYTYIHIGHVYGSDGAKHDYNKSGRRMPIHMRAGHNRQQAFGKERTERKLIWIPPVLVNYDGATKPVLEKRVTL